MVFADTDPEDQLAAAAGTADAQALPVGDARGNLHIHLPMLAVLVQHDAALGPRKRLFQGDIDEARIGFGGGSLPAAKAAAESGAAAEQAGEEIAESV